MFLRYMWMPNFIAFLICKAHLYLPVPKDQDEFQIIQELSVHKEKE